MRRPLEPATVRQFSTAGTSTATKYCSATANPFFKKPSRPSTPGKCFLAEITTIFGRQTPRENLTVAVLYRANSLPFYLLMPARIVYLIDDTTPRGNQHVERYGFAYGTLPDHPECGEERFLVEWDRKDDSVHYDLVAISRPNHWFVRLGYLYTRHQQARFRRLSGLAMQQATRRVG